jgi:hypothetical protein
MYKQGQGASEGTELANEPRTPGTRLADFVHGGPMKPLRHEDSVSQVEELQKKLDAALEELAQLKA